MQVIKGNMWDWWTKVDHWLVTTNCIVKRNGALVMGAGLAKDVRDRWRHLDTPVDVQLGQAIQTAAGRQYSKVCKSDFTYGVILGRKLGIFQVKHHFKDSADLHLIRHSAEMLAAEATANPSKVYALNFPGIGNGKLSYRTVHDVICHVLPDNVLVFTK